MRKFYFWDFKKFYFRNKKTLGKLKIRKKNSYGANLLQNVGLISWTNMLYELEFAPLGYNWINMYQLVGPKFHINFGVAVNSAIVDSFVCQTCWYNNLMRNMLVQHSIVNLHPRKTILGTKILRKNGRESVPAATSFIINNQPNLNVLFTLVERLVF